MSRNAAYRIADKLTGREEEELEAVTVARAWARLDGRDWKAYLRRLEKELSRETY